MAFIVPSILEETPEAFAYKASVLTRISGVERLQVDFGDGLFVPHKTLDAVAIDPLNPAFVWEAHLMLRSPKDFLDYKIAGFSTIIVHLEAFENNDELQKALTSIRSHAMTPALAINPETPVAKLIPYVETVSQFTLLSVTPGFQGGTFLPQTFERVAELRKLTKNGTIEVDGGVTADNIADLILSGADCLVVGHALFETENVAENFLHLEAASQKINQN